MTIYDLTAVLSELKSVSKGDITRVPLPDDALIEEYEREIGFNFPEDYKIFLKEAGNVRYGVIEPLYLSKNEIFFSRELSQAIVDARKWWKLPVDWLPICEDNSDYYCIVPDGRVRFWPHNGYSDESWENLASWIKNVWIDEYLRMEDDD